MRVNNKRLIYSLIIFLTTLVFIFFSSALYAPGVALNSPANFATKANTTVIFNCSAVDDTNLKNITLYTNTSGNWQAQQTKNISGTNGSVTFTITNISTNTNYKWNCLARDNESLSGFAASNYTFRIGNDTNLPNVTLLSPNDTELDDDGLILFIYNVTDATSGISQCSLFVNGILNQTESDISEGVEQYFVIDGVVDGSYNWSVRCTDNSDYARNGTSAIRFFDSADYTKPAIFLLNPDDGAISKSGNIIFEYIVLDYGYNISSCSLYINNTLNQTDDTINETAVQNFTLSNLTYGIYTWKVSCDDASPQANHGNSYTFEIIVNKEPNVTLNGPASYSIDYDGDVTFNYTVQDDGLLRNCSLYHNASSTWVANETHTFIQTNYSLYFTLNNLPNGNIRWNVLCSDDARVPSSDEGIADFVIIINKTTPQVSFIPNLSWGEDEILTINLSNYFTDLKGDDLTFTAQYPSTINVTIINETNIAILEAAKNWWGNASIIITAFDNHGMNKSSNNVTLTVFEQGDTPPRFILISPSNNSLDTDGYIFFEINITDDYGLSKVVLYSNRSGNLSFEEERNLTGITNYTVLNITNLSDGIYTWELIAYDNAYQTKSTGIYRVNVSIGASINHNIFDWIVTNITYPAVVWVEYSIYLNNTLILGNLTIREVDDNSIFWTKNMSNSQKIEMNSSHNLTQFEKLNISSINIFDNNFTVGRNATLNFTLDYFYQNKQYKRYARFNITIKNESEV